MITVAGGRDGCVGQKRDCSSTAVALLVNGTCSAYKEPQIASKPKRMTIKRPDIVCRRMHDPRVTWVQKGKGGHAIVQHSSAAYIDRHIEQS